MKDLIFDLSFIPESSIISDEDTISEPNYDDLDRPEWSTILIETHKSFLSSGPAKVGYRIIFYSCPDIILNHREMLARLCTHDSIDDMYQMIRRNEYHKLVHEILIQKRKAAGYGGVDIYESMIDYLAKHLLDQYNLIKHVQTVTKIRYMARDIVICYNTLSLAMVRTEIGRCHLIIGKSKYDTVLPVFLIQNLLLIKIYVKQLGDMKVNETNFQKQFMWWLWTFGYYSNCLATNFPLIVSAGFVVFLIVVGNIIGLENIYGHYNINDDRRPRRIYRHNHND
uniref:Ankyrin repeat protein n=1 Tax=Rhabditophanes sp. KR3021 TaxID=114890 RepID=A0AC35TVB3_9BILA